MPTPPSATAGRAAELALRREQTMKLVNQGWTYAKIAKEGGLGHNSPQSVHSDVKAVLKQRTKQLDHTAEQWRARQTELLNEVLAVAHDIMSKDHLAVSNGRVVQREDPITGEMHDVIDDAPRLAAADRLIKVAERMAKMYGTDAPVKTEVTGTQTVEYKIGVSPDELDKL